MSLFDEPDGVSRPFYAAQAAERRGYADKHWRWLVYNDKAPAPSLYDWEGRPRWWRHVVDNYPHYPARRLPRTHAGGAGG